MILTPDEPPAGPWRVAPVAELVGLLLAATGDPAGRPRVVAVDGRSAGGKSTLAGLLHAAVPRSAVVPTDDVAWYESFFGWADLLVHGVLEPLHEGRAVRFRPPAWVARHREGAIALPAGLELVIVEGVGAARREIMPLVDAVVWVQSDLAEGFRRGLLRDGRDQESIAFWREWEAAELPFLAEQRPWDRADVIVNGSPVPGHDPATEVVLGVPAR